MLDVMNANSLLAEQEMLIAVLACRYGFVPDAISRVIHEVSDEKLLHDLSRIAKHTSSWKSFLEELRHDVIRATSVCV